MSVFCRHNRLLENCTICQREQAPDSPFRKVEGRTTTKTRTKTAAGAKKKPGGMVRRQIARATDDGFSSPLMPGVRATSDAERLADALGAATARLDFPGPHPEVSELTGDAAVELAFEIVGGQTWEPAKFRDEASWTPQKRFARLFDRLRIPGFTREQRFEFLVTLAASGQIDAEADQLFFDVKATDATTLAAKRALSSGDAMLLERRAKELAEGAGVPVAALDFGLRLWDSTDPVEPDAAVRAALRL